MDSKNQAHAEKYLADPDAYPVLGKIIDHQDRRAKKKEEARSAMSYMKSFEKKERQA